MKLSKELEPVLSAKLYTEKSKEIQKNINIGPGSRCLLFGNMTFIYND